jgi:hypothetical protein
MINFGESKVSYPARFLSISRGLLVVALFGLGGCVTSSPYKADPAHPIRTIAISRDVQMPEKMIFYGLSQSMAGMFGGVVGALSTMYRQGEHFDLPRVLRENLSSELSRSGKFKVVASGAADAEVRIRVREYGFVQALGFMRRSVKPILTIETTMVRSDGVQIWQSGVVVNQAEKQTPTILPEKLSDRAVAVDALHTAARIWAGKTAGAVK